MKNGYYISLYITVNKLAHCLKTGLRHDQAIALFLLKDHSIQLIRYWELERLFGQKQYDRAFFDKEQLLRLLSDLLSREGISIDDIIEIWGLDSCESKKCQKEFLHFYPHAFYHLFSGLLMNTDIFYNENILVLMMDEMPDFTEEEGNTEKSYYLGCYSQKGDLHYFPICSPGPIWTKAANRFKMKEGTLMALASACKGRCEYPLSPNEQHYVSGNVSKAAEEYLEELCSHIWGLEENSEKTSILIDNQFSLEENRISMVMKHIQSITVQFISYNIRLAKKYFNIIYEDTVFSILGGVGLNCPANSQIMSIFPFKIWQSPPSINDSGQALGMGLFQFYHRMDTVSFHLMHAYYGEADNEIAFLTSNREFKEYIKNIDDLNYHQAVLDIIQEPVVWFNGNSEIGPRSLGNRSLLGDPRYLKTKVLLNKIKKRQWWRPVAPVVLEDLQQEWFENVQYSPFMQRTFQLYKDKLSWVPAVAHMDSSARIQSLRQEDNPMLYQLIYIFYLQTGVPMLCNTSLNDRGEPIINRIEEALHFALRKGIKIVYINTKRIILHRHDQFREQKILTRYYNRVYLEDEPKRKQDLKVLNPFNLPLSKIIDCFHAKTLQRLMNMDLTDFSNVQVIRKMMKLYE